MRSPRFFLALVLVGCSTADDRGATVAPVAPLGPDAIVLRVPAQGGAARAYRYPALDTVIWNTRAALPPQMRAVGFNIDAGTLVISDAAGLAWRLTFGSGQLDRAMATPLAETASIDGTSIFGTSAGAVLRLTPSEQRPWQVRTAATLSQLQPLRDGGVLLVGQRGSETILTRFRPPATTAVDSAVFAGQARLISAAGGDRYYLSDGPRGLVSVRARDLETLARISIGDSLRATASSPSGDRVYVLGAEDDAARIQVINKYTDDIAARIDVPTDANALRMDPLGRYLLVHFGGDADSVLVIAVATDKVIGRLVSPWRLDLPLVFPDGRLATLRGDDVVVLTADAFRPAAVIPGGAKDIWTVVQWNGFRRRAGDTPVRATATTSDTSRQAGRESGKSQSKSDSSGLRDSSIRRPDSAALRRPARGDSLAPRSDTTRRPLAVPDTQSRNRPAAAALPSTVGERGTFVVQFAALKAERPAQQLAASIKANGEKARVVVTATNGVELYRVILGPFRTRVDAERAGEAAGRDYWVFEGGSN